MRRAVVAALVEAGVAAHELAGIWMTANGSPVYRQLYDAALSGELSVVPQWTWEAATGHALAATAICGALVASFATDQRPQLSLTVGFGGQNGVVVSWPGTATAQRFVSASQPQPSLPARVAITGRAVVDRTTIPDDLEDGFPGRWNPRRPLPEPARALVAAVRLALAQAGWWRVGEALPVGGGLVVGTDCGPLEAGERLQVALQAGWLPLLPSDFLAALPSTAAACVGLTLGLLDHQATLIEGGCSGLAAAAHARDAILQGRASRLVAAAVTVIEPLSAARLELAPGALAVAWCIEARADSVQWGLPLARDDAMPIESATLLADLPHGWQGLAAAGLLAADRLLERGGCYRLLHRDRWLDCTSELLVGDCMPCVAVGPGRADQVAAAQSVRGAR
jgi:hypothetical protein